MSRKVLTRELQRIRSTMTGVQGALDGLTASTEYAEDRHVVVVAETSWQRHDVEAFVKRVVHLTAARALLELCSERPTAWFSFDDVHRRAANASERQTSNELSAVTRVLVTMRGSKDWPLQVETAPRLRYRAEYRMAGWIRDGLAARRRSE
jgi:hypothetical protein